jgi:hypothetical protein
MRLVKYGNLKPCNPHVLLHGTGEAMTAPTSKLVGKKTFKVPKDDRI